MAAELAGAGEVVLTTPAAAAAAIEVPAGADRYLVFSLPSAAVMGELPGERAATLALPAGRYLVARHVRRAASVSMVDLSWGGRRRLVDRDFRPVAREELVARGGEVDVRMFRLEPRIGFEHAWRSARPDGWLVAIAGARSFGAIDLDVALGFVTGVAATPAWTGREQTLIVTPGASHRWFLGPVTVAAGVALDLRLSRQRLTRVEPDRAAAAGFTTDQDRRYSAVGPAVGLRASVPLGDRLCVSASVAAVALGRREAAIDGGRRLSFLAAVDVTLGGAFIF
jgi:hypothetical protein